MRLEKFSILIVVITFAALLYVHQQVEILKTSYSIRANENRLSRLVNENRAIEGECASLKSPSNVERILKKNKLDLEPPKELKIVELREPKRPFDFASEVETFTKRLARLFSMKSQAIAESNEAPTQPQAGCPDGTK